MLIATYFHPGDLSGSDWLFILIALGVIVLVGLAAVLVPFFLILKWLSHRHAPPAEAGASDGTQKSPYE